VEASNDERRRKLRRVARAALRSSGTAAARELALLGSYSSGELGSRSQGEFASARSDMAAFLFLVHSLAADLLHSEGKAHAAAKKAAAEAAAWGRTKIAFAEEPEESDDEESAEGGYSGHGMWAPLLARSPAAAAGQRRMRWEAGAGRRGGLSSLAAEMRQLGAAGASALGLHVVRLRGAARKRGRIALKVSLSFVPALAASVYLLGCDCTFVGTVAYICSYGSQYAGGSLRRAVLRGVGVATGVAAGATLAAMLHGLLRLSGLEAGSTWHAALVCIAGTLLIAGWVCPSLVLHFRGGPYAYASLCAAFTAMKFVLWGFSGGISANTTVMYTMYACLLTVSVEIGVLPVDASDLLRSRLAAALAGASAALSALVTSAVEQAPSQAAAELPISLQAAREALQCARDSADEHRHRALPDLTEHLKQAGTYDKYLEWRAGYLNWRRRGTKGSHGELTSTILHRELASPDTSSGGSHEPATAHRPSPPHLASLAETGDDDEAAGGGGMKREGEAQRQYARLSEAFTPAAVNAAPADAEVLEPIAAVPLPALHAMTADPADVSSKVYLSATDPAFTEGIVKLEEMLADGPGRKGAEGSPCLGSGAGAGFFGAPVGQLDPDSAAKLPMLARVLSASLHGDRAPAEAEDTLAPGEASRPAWSSEQPEVPLSPCVSLTDVQSLLEEIGVALLPAENLALQAAERLDAKQVDVHAWRSLAGRLAIVRLRMQVLASIALRLRRGVCVAELLGGPGEDEAAAGLVAAFGMALAAARSAVFSGVAPSPRDAATLEARLQDSAMMLVRALAQRPPQQLPAAREGGLTSEVLVGTAGTTLAALLRDAAEVLAQAVLLAGPPAEVRAAGEPLEASRPCSALGGPPSALDLPDLTDRLRELGMYEEYTRWRDGYLRWRTGKASGAHGEITKDTTT